MAKGNDKAKKPKKAKKGGADEARWPSISVSSHPRAARSVRRAKAWAGLLALVLVAVLSSRAGVEPFEAGVRALVAGIVAYLVVWGAGVALWQRLVYAEARAEVERRREEQREILRRLNGEEDPAGGEQAVVS